ncbi:hypothetical protein CapIbe_020722 [Capra ibex]
MAGWNGSADPSRGQQSSAGRRHSPVQRAEACLSVRREDIIPCSELCVERELEREWLSGVSEHTQEEGRHTSQSRLGVQSQATSASGGKLAAPAGRRAARGGTATVPIKALMTSAAAFLPQPGPSGPPPTLQ